MIIKIMLITHLKEATRRNKYVSIISIKPPHKPRQICHDREVEDT